jgi:conjugal transfer mating pair stabilization protein TraG
MFVIYTQGETSSFRAAIEGVALVFQDPFFSSDAAMGLGYGVFLGILILLTIFIYKSAVKKTFEIKMVLLPLIAYIILTGPKATVHIQDVYQKDAPQVVDNIPIGLALPISIMSSAAYIFTQEFEQAYGTPESPRMLTDGFVSPLKTLNAIRGINMNAQNSDLSRLVRDTWKSCIGGASDFSIDTYLNAPDSYSYFNNYLITKAKGVVPFTAMNGSQTVISCSDAADKISNGLHAFMYGDGSAGIDTLVFNFKEMVNFELMNKNQSGGVHRIDNTEDFLQEFAKLTERTTDDGRLFMTNALFNQMMVNASFCASKGAENMEDRSAQCAVWVQSNEMMSEDNAAAASGFMNVMQNGQNALLIFAILLFPIMVLVIVYLGTTSITAIGGYLIFIASTYLWMPMATIVNLVAITRFKNTVYTFTQREDSDLFGVTDYPAFYEAVSNALSLANGLMATIPMLCVFLFLGMGQFALALQNRWNQGRSKYADSTLDSPPIIGSSPLISQKSAFKSNGLGGMMPTDGGKAWDTNFTKKDSNSVMTSMALSEKKSILEAKKAAISDQLSKSDASSSSGGETAQLKTNINSKYELKLESGQGFLITHGTTDTGTFGRNGAIDAKIVVNKDNEIVAVTGMDSAELKLRIGFGKGTMNNGFGLDMLNPDGSLATDGTGAKVPMGQGTITKGGEGALNLRVFRIDAGASYKNRDGINWTNVESDNDNKTQERIHLKNTGAEAETASRYVYKLVEETTSNEMKNGREHSTANNVMVGSSSTTNRESDRRLVLERMLVETENELISTNKQLEKSLSMSFSTNLLAEDILHRIAAQRSVLKDLESLEAKYMQENAQAWNEAKAKAADALKNSKTAIYNEAEPRNYEALVIYSAAFILGAQSANDAHKAITGVDTLKMLDIAPPKKYAWENWKDIEKEADKAFSAVEKSFGFKPDALKANDMTVLNPESREGYFNAPIIVNGPTPLKKGAIVGQGTHKIMSSSSQDSTLETVSTPIGGSLKLIGTQQEMNGIRLYNAFLSAGFTTRQARILTVEVGRENSWQISGMYGLHNDPKKSHIINGGIISFNGDRKIALDKFMQARGLMISGNAARGTGSYAVGQASLNAMASFMRHELEHGGRTGWTKGWLALNNDKLTDSQIHSVVGRHYIVWAYGEAGFSSSGMHNLREFNRIFNNVLTKQGKATGAAPQINYDARKYSVAQLQSGKILSTNIQKPELVIPTELRYDSNRNLSKEEVKALFNANKDIVTKKGYQKIEDEYGVKIVKGKGSEFETEVIDRSKFYKKLANNIELGASAKRLPELVANSPAFLLEKAKEKITSVEASLKAELDTASEKNHTIFSHPNVNPYMPKNSKEEMGLQDADLGPKTIHAFNISKNVEQTKIDDLIRSEAQKNEVFEKQNQSLIESILASKAADTGKRKEKNEPKTVEQYLQEKGTPESKKVIMDAVNNVNRKRSSSDAAKWAGLEE